MRGQHGQTPEQQALALGISCATLTALALCRMPRDRGDVEQIACYFIWHTGCRPQEVRYIEPRHVDLDRAVVVIPKEKAKGKRYPPFIHLHGPALEIALRLMAVRGEGKLFRNMRGEPWTKYALCNRMDRLSRVAGVKKTVYDMRHGFATQKLVQESQDHLTIAELMGRRDGTMLAKVYAHLDRNDAHMKTALEG